MSNATKGTRSTDEAIERGLDFIYRFGSERKSFNDYGSFLICCFALLASSSRDSKLRRLGKERAKQFLKRWTRLHRSLPTNASTDQLLDYILVRYAERRIRVTPSLSAVAINAVAHSFSVLDLLGFDPVKEPPPSDLPFSCACGFQNLRGRKSCKQCRRRLLTRSRYRVWWEALANTYVSERSGVWFGAPYEDVLHWVPSMRPYPAPADEDEEFLRDAIYAVTHVVYTLNDYGTYRLSPKWLPREFEFLKTNVEAACSRDDPEVVGELLDSLKAFGLGPSDPFVARGADFLLANQNDDGSWGSADESVRTRCHTTWTAIDGLRDYTWRGERLSRPDLRKKLKLWFR